MLETFGIYELVEDQRQLQITEKQLRVERKRERGKKLACK